MYTVDREVESEWVLALVECSVWRWPGEIPREKNCSCGLPWVIAAIVGAGPSIFVLLGIWGCVRMIWVRAGNI